MQRWAATILALALLGAGLTADLRAQAGAPSADEFATIAVATDGPLAFVAAAEQLLIAAGVDVQLYDVAARDTVQERSAVSFEQPPVALAAAAQFALAAVHGSAEADLLWIVAPDTFSDEAYAPVNALEIPAATRAITLSPDAAAALIYGRSGFVTLQINAADNILVSTLFDTADAPLVAAALTNNTALINRAGRTTIDAVDLGDTIRARYTVRAELDLGAAVTAIAVSPDGVLAAATTISNRLTLFNPRTMRVVTSLGLDDGPVETLAFGQAGERRYLALHIDRRAAVLLLDVTDPTDDVLPGSIGVSEPVQRLAVQDDLIAVHTGARVHLFTVSSE